MTARKMELTGGAYWTLNLKLTFFFRLVRTGWTKTLYNTGRQSNNRQNTGGNRQNGQN